MYCQMLICMFLAVGYIIIPTSGLRICLGDGYDCDFDDMYCCNVCDNKTNTCVYCLDEGSSCTMNSDCCRTSKFCTYGSCKKCIMADDNVYCKRNSDCCESATCKPYVTKHGTYSHHCVSPGESII
uniref:Disintegrin domain-containing protein n=1 Tax=Clastoptera arizonana TaxID=38151 RepID=A0A1B6CV00_9HEMI